MGPLFWSCLAFVAILLIAMFFFIYAASSLLFPQSRTTVEEHAAGWTTPIQWWAVCWQSVSGLIAGALAVSIFLVFVIPGWRTHDAELAIQRFINNTFQEEPIQIIFVDDNPLDHLFQAFDRKWQKRAKVQTRGGTTTVTVTHYRTDHRPHHFVLKCRLENASRFDKDATN